MFYTTEELHIYIGGFYLKVKEKLVKDNVYEPLNVHFGTKPLQENEFLYCYADDAGYHYCYEERGVVCFHKTTQELSEITYMVIADKLESIAFKYEFLNRLESQDSRRIAFEKLLEYMSIVSDEFAERTKSDISKILKEAPFYD